METAGRLVWLRVLLFVTGMLTVRGDGSFLCGINGLRLSKRLRRVADEALGLTKLQKEVDSRTTFYNAVPDGDNLITEMTKQLGEVMEKYNTAVRNLREAVDSDRVGSLDKISECCNLTGDVLKKLRYNPNFYMSVTTQEVCYMEAVDASRTGRAYPEVLSAAKKNLQDLPNVKWQYFGNEEGIHSVYPARVDLTCDDYDPRLRPWYLQAFAPEPKDIVIVFDGTDDGRLRLIKLAIKTILQTTNPNDRIGLIAFAYRPETAPGTADTSTCYTTKLAVATPRNRKYFIKFTEGKTFLNGTATRFKPALEKAFRLFRNSRPMPTDKEKRRKLLIFLTDSDPAAPNPRTVLTFVKEEWNKTGDPVLLQTYGLGGITGATEDLLRNMARTTYFSNSLGVKMYGEYTRLESDEKLRYNLKAFYNVFTEPRNYGETPVVTVPYVDFSGLGLVVSICMPVSRNSTLRGVTCVDARVSDLFYNVSYFQSGTDSYAFLIDTRGRTILHPKLPKPVTVQQDPIFMDIWTLERAPEASDVIKSMLEQGTGSKTFLTRKFGAQGASPGATTNNRLVTAHYYWGPVPNSEYSLCIVLSEGNVLLNMTLDDDITTNYLHPYNIAKRSTCSQQHVQSTREVSTVVFTGDAFLHPPAPIVEQESRAREYTGYFTDKNHAPVPEFRPYIRLAVTITGVVDDIWKSQPSSKYGPKLYRRHLVTINGVMRMYPGARFLYDPAVLPWYNNAMSSRAQIIFTYNSSEEYTTLIVSHVIFEARRNGRHSSYDFPVAVLAAEFRPEFFHAMLSDMFPACRASDMSCFLVDESGYLLTHRTLVGRNASQQHHFNNHIMAQEPDIALDLLKKGYMTREPCNAFEQLRVQHTFRISIIDGLVSNPDGSPSYELHVVVGTNIFLGMVNLSTLGSDLKTRCHCSADRTIRRCVSDSSPGKCECPCYTRLVFDYCNNTFPRDNNPPPSCALPPPDQSILLDLAEGQLSDQPLCFPLKCEEVTEESECWGYIGCQWCYKESSTKSCIPSTECDAAPLIVPVPDRTGAIVATVVVILLILLLLLVVLALLCKYRPQVYSALWHKCSGCLTSGNTPDQYVESTTAGTQDRISPDETSPGLRSLPLAPIAPDRRPPARIPDQVGTFNHGYSPGSEGSIYSEPYGPEVHAGNPSRTRTLDDPTRGQMPPRVPPPHSFYIHPKKQSVSEPTSLQSAPDSSWASTELSMLTPDAGSGSSGSTPRISKSLESPKPQRRSPNLPPRLPGMGPDDWIRQRTATRSKPATAASSSRPVPSSVTIPSSTVTGYSNVLNPDGTPPPPAAAVPAHGGDADQYPNYPLTPTRRYTNTFTGDPRSLGGHPLEERSSNSAPARSASTLPAHSSLRPSMPQAAVSRPLDLSLGPSDTSSDRLDLSLPLDLRLPSPTGEEAAGEDGGRVHKNEPIDRRRSNGDGEEDPEEDPIYIPSFLSTDSGIDPTYGRGGADRDSLTIPKEPY